METGKGTGIIMTYCSHCGTKLKPNMKFCWNCGTKNRCYVRFSQRFHYWELAYKR